MYFRYAVIVFVLILFATSCGRTGIHWNPDFWISDYENTQIINENGVTVRCDEPQFNSYACLSKDKIIELLNILRRYKMPPEARLQIDQIESLIK